MTIQIDLSGIQALTFDLFGTILDLGGSLTPLYCNVSSKERLFGFTRPILGTVAGTSAIGAISGHNHDAGSQRLFGNSTSGFYLHAGSESG